MTGRVIVDDEGIWLVESRGRSGYPWSEIVKAAVYVLLLPPADDRLITVEVDHVSGEFLSINDRVDGFDDALAAMVSRGGCAAPDLAALAAGDIVHISLAASS